MSFTASLIRSHLAKFKIKFSQDVKHGRLVTGTRFPYSLVEVQGPWAMEDRACVHAQLGNNNKISLYGVFDGHNGSIAAEFCSLHIPQLLASSNYNLHTHAKEALISIFKQTDSDFLRQGAKVTQSTGTTAIVMLADENVITIASVGDSRAILLKKDGTYKSLNVEHKPDRLDERVRITEAGGTIEHLGVWRVEGLLAMSRAIGDEILKSYVIPDPDVTETLVDEDKDSFVILASDGLFDVLRNDEVANLCRGVDNCEVVARRLANAVVDRGIVDNTTILVVGCKFSPS